MKLQGKSSTNWKAPEERVVVQDARPVIIPTEIKLVADILLLDKLDRSFPRKDQATWKLETVQEVMVILKVIALEERQH